MRIRWRGLQLPSQVVPEYETLSQTYGKFVAEPFERGFGATIGNSLRRVLLSSLEGSAVTSVKIQGVQHEITTISGVVEDVTDIILNIKSIVVKNYTDQPKILRIERTKAGVVKAGDIQTDGTVEVINKDLVLATLTVDTPFVMELTVENGRGYVPAGEHTTREREVGVILVDSVFSPVVRVKHDVEETRVGRKTNYDRLVLEIWTDGSLRPDMALVEAAKILRKHLNPFVQFSELGQQIFTPPGAAASGDPALEAKLSLTVADLKLSVRASNCLESEKINTVRDLVQRSEHQLLEVRNFGDLTLREVKTKLTELGLQLGMRVPESARS